MTSPSGTCHSNGCEVQLPQGFGERGLCLDHYLAEATERLDVATQCLRPGPHFDEVTVDWLLRQVDFVVETISDETAILNKDHRCKLLELLLAIANLNEHARQIAVPIQITH